MALALCGLGLLLPRPALAQGEPGAPAPVGPAGAYPSADVGGLSLFHKNENAKVSPDGAVPPPVLTNDGTPNAFDTPCTCHNDCGFFASLGPTALRRSDLHSNVLAVLDPGVSITGFPQFFDSGQFPPANSLTVLNAKELGPRTYGWGVRGTVGYQYGCDTVEVSGFYVFDQSQSRTRTYLSQIDLPFAAATPNIPLGFTGDNNLFLQADQVIGTFKSNVYGVEANYRTATGGGFEWIFGVRYLGIHESLSLFVDDDNLTLPPSAFDPTLQATYTVSTNNNIVCPQIGFEGEWPVVSFLAIGGWAKAGGGANFITTHTKLVRGDGFVPPAGPNNSHFRAVFGQVYDVSLFGDILVSDRVRVRAGYQFLLAVGVAAADQQVDFNLDHVNGAMSYNNTIFYHGPMFEVSLFF